MKRPNVWTVCRQRDKKKKVLSPTPTLDANQIWQKQVEVGDGEEAELEVGDGEAVAGRSAGGNPSAVEMGHVASWRRGDVELWPGGAERGRWRRERSGRRRRRGTGEKVGQPDDVGRKKRAPNTCSPECPWLYTQDDL